MTKSLIEESENVMPVWGWIWIIWADVNDKETSRLDHSRDNSLNGTWLRILPISNKKQKLISKPALHSSKFLVFNYAEINLQEQYRVFIPQDGLNHSHFFSIVYTLSS